MLRYATLPTVLPRYARNETERYAKVAARTQAAGDTCTKNIVIARNEMTKQSSE